MKALGLALLAALALPGAAWADHPFILPSSTLLSGDGNTVTFDAAGSDHVFFFDHRPLQLGSVRVSKPDGSPATPANGMQGRFRSTFDVVLDQQGTWKVASEQRIIVGSFKLNGEDRRVGPRRGPPPGQAPAAPRGGASEQPGSERRQPPVPVEEIPAGATDLHLTETNSRTETFVTDGAPTTAVLKPTGQGLELDPITHPNALAAGETARFRFLIDGKPAPGLKVTVIPGGDRYRDDTGAMALTTEADGAVAIRWPAAGPYWLGVEAEDRAPADKRAQVRHLSYAATLEVMTP